MLSRLHMGREITALMAVGAMFLTGCATPVRVSLTAAGVEPNGDNTNIALSADGRFTVFQSRASNLVPGDTNFGPDIFLRDNQTGALELISASINGGTGNSWSYEPDITPDGRYVVFSSSASDLVAGDTNASRDVFIYDRQNDVMEIISVDSSGMQLSAISRGGSVTADGNTVVFFSTGTFVASDTNTSFDVYKRDRLTGSTSLVSLALSGGALGESSNPRISKNGANVAFESFANGFTNNDTGFFKKIYARAELFGLRFNVAGDANAGAELGDIVGSGFNARIVYSSTASNITPGDTGGFSDIFVHHIEFTGGAFNITTTNITDGADGDSVQPAVEGGVLNQMPRIVYETTATNLQEVGATPADTNGLRDVYIYEPHPVSSGSRHRLLSVTALADLTNDISARAALSSDGKTVAFESVATNFGPEDTNGKKDVYLRQVNVPLIDTVTGALTPGQTETLVLHGEFPPGDWDAWLRGDGVVSAMVTAVTTTSVTVDVELAASASIGPRDLWIYEDAPHLGLSAPLGAADRVSVGVTP